MHSRLFPLLVGFSVTACVLACDSEPGPASTEASGKALNDELQPADSTAAALAAGTTVAPRQAQRTCPAGRWHYDYSDQALEVMTKNVANAKIIKEEQEFTCEISAGEEGVIACDTGKTPVHNVVETQQAGMPMTVSVQLEGKGSTRFRRLDNRRLEVTGSNTEDMKLEASVTLAGKSIPFPAEQMVSIFGEEKSVLSYKCEDDKLFIKPEIDNTKTTWQEFTPAK